MEQRTPDYYSSKQALETRVAQFWASHPVGVLAIDGCSGSGKTTLAAELCQKFEAAVIHMDDFFLQPMQRTAQRREEPGGNIDYERFEAEVLPYLGSGRVFCYRRFDCSRMTMGEEVAIAGGPLVLEGVYSCHPRFLEKIDCRVFLKISREEQVRRIEARSGTEKLQRFIREWIPLEDRYFSAFRIEENADCVFKEKN